MEKAKTQVPNSMNVNEVIAQVEKAIKEDKTASSTLIASIQLMLLLVKMLVGRLSLNSKNSSKSPSSDKNKKDKDDTDKDNDSSKKQGGQKGHQGNTLKFVEDPEKS